MRALLPIALLTLALPACAGTHDCPDDPVAKVQVRWPTWMPSTLQVSALDQLGDDVLLVPQLAGPSQPLLWLRRADVLAALAGGAPVVPRPIALPDFVAPARVALDDGRSVDIGWEGFEAVRVLSDGQHLRLVSESSITGSRDDQPTMVACVFTATLAADRTRLDVDPTPVCQPLVGAVDGRFPRNSGAESLTDDGALLPELWTPDGDARAWRCFAGATPPCQPGPTLPRLPWRITDLTRGDATGRVWAVNYLFPREGAPGGAYRTNPDPLGVVVPTPAVPQERLVELQVSFDAVTLTGRTVSLRPQGTCAARNWEGAVRFDRDETAGVLVITDTFPHTRLGWVAVPR